MNNSNQKIIDSHVHLDHVFHQHPDRIQWMQDQGIIPISWSFALSVENLHELKAYLQAQSETIQHLNEKGFQCFFLSGIHPRNIPSDLRAEDVEALLSPFLEHPMSLGIGEIGLEYGSQKEQEIFLAQLEMGKYLKNRGKKFGIHTPLKNKSEMTEKILSLSEAYPDIKPITVIDHCTPETIGSVLEKGYWAGITLSPAKASLRDMENIVRHHSDDVHRMMCNTDSGTLFYEDMRHLWNSKAFLPEIRDRLAFQTAFQFFLS